MVELSPVERQILANQYRILCAINPKDANYYHWGEFVDILEQGWEGQYGRVLAQVQENHLSAEACELVANTLTMHSCLRDLDGRSSVDVSEFEQVGFDGNNEFEHLGYAEFLFNRNRGGFPGIAGVVNNHRPSLDRYRQMVAEWKRSAHPTRLTERDAARILAAGANLGA